MVDIATYNPAQHAARWEDFIVTSYKNPNYILLSPEFLRWQFLDNPANATGAYTLWLVLHRDAVVAQLGYVPFTGRTPAGETFAGAYPINLIVHPDYRASGLGVIVLKKLLSSIDCVLNPGSSDAGAVLCAGLGMRDLGTLHRHLCVLDQERALALAVHHRLPSAAAEAAHRSIDNAEHLVPMARLPATAAARFMPPASAYGADRSREFLRWRYEDHPAFDYKFILSRDGDSVLIFHEEREPTTGLLILRIVDLLGREAALSALLGAALQAARARSAVLVDFFCSLTCYDAALCAAGFFNEAEHPDGRIAALFQPLDFRKTGIRVLVSGPAQAQLDAEWYVTKGDSDQDRPNDKRAVGRQTPA